MIIKIKLESGKEIELTPEEYEELTGKQQIVVSPVIVFPQAPVVPGPYYPPFYQDPPRITWGSTVHNRAAM